MSWFKDRLKDVLHKPAAQKATRWLAALYIRFVHVSSRWQVVGLEHVTPFWDQDRPLIFSFWHNRLMMMPSAWRKGKKIRMLISQHRDGVMIAGIINEFGLGVMEGSTSKGGASAMRGLLKTLREGQSVGMTPDGPRGPRMRAALGVAQIAILSGVPILPCAYAVSRFKILKSWDKFIVALPFSKAAYVFGEPLYPPTDRSPEAEWAFLVKISKELTAVTLEADRLTGFPSIEPGMLGVEDEGKRI